MVVYCCGDRGDGERAEGAEGRRQHDAAAAEASGADGRPPAAHRSRSPAPAAAEGGAPAGEPAARHWRRAPAGTPETLPPADAPEPQL